VHAVRRVGFGTWALAAQLSAWAVRPALSLRLHVSTARPQLLEFRARTHEAGEKEAASRRRR